MLYRLSKIVPVVFRSKWRTEDGAPLYRHIWIQWRGRVLAQHVRRIA